MVLASSLYFTKLMLEHKRKEMEFRGKLDDHEDSGKSLTESELSGLIRDAVREETSVVLERMQEVEDRLNLLDSTSSAADVDEPPESEPKTLGRTSRLRSP
jgi:hypothetical protein